MRPIAFNIKRPDTGRRLSTTVGFMIALLALLAVCFSTEAWACPYCNGRKADTGFGYYLIYGLMLSMPFALVWTVTRVFRKMAPADTQRADD